ncbi:sensor histidine kinase [Lysobacter korlensis]|uniref:Sensor histidine kinase n=1 Tax=Lysobacter korlensis TaxID=553636 RepID=A0ABV6S0R5_9GAMM
MTTPPPGAQRAEAQPPASARPPLRRPRRMLLGGVSVALARHVGMPLPLARAGFLVLTVFGGAGALLYLWLWALVPLEDRSAEREDERPVRRAAPVAAVSVVLGAVAGLIAVAWSFADGGASLTPGILECTLLSSAAVAWTFLLDTQDAARRAGYLRTVRTGAAVVLVATGVGLLISDPWVGVAVLAVVMIVLGAVVLLLPRIAGLWTDLITERSARVREEQRAEIAAHLHDSVLQTLALIQNRADAQSEIARLARAQERELRDWLFAGTDPFAGDLATELRRLAGALELEHPVRIDLVVAGAAGELPAEATAALLGAAREAMLNAARHAGGDVSVYLESTPTGVDVFVRDRGAGFDQAAVPAGRLGIRESIHGRMARAGGVATVTSGDTGTEVHLHLDTGGRS